MIKHAFVPTKGEPADATLVKTSNWNGSGIVIALNLSGDGTHV